MNIKIQETDILWKYYKKSFELGYDTEYKTPTSICPYFWASVWGFILSLYLEIKLWKTICLGIATGSAGMAGIFGIFNFGPSIQSLLGCSVLAFLPFFIISAYVCVVLVAAGWVVPIFIIGTRLDGKWRSIYEAVLGGLMWLFFLSALGYGIYTTSWSDVSLSYDELLVFFQMLGFIVLATISALIIIGVALFAIDKFMKTNFFKHLSVYLLAIKNKACPMVTIDPSIEPNFEPKVKSKSEDKGG